MGEHLPCKQGVKGSNPFISTACVNMQLLYLENRIQNQKTRNTTMKKQRTREA